MRDARAMLKVMYGSMNFRFWALDHWHWAKSGHWALCNCKMTSEHPFMFQNIQHHVSTLESVSIWLVLLNRTGWDNQWHPPKISSLQPVPTFSNLFRRRRGRSDLEDSPPSPSCTSQRHGPVPPPGAGDALGGRGDHLGLLGGGSVPIYIIYIWWFYDDLCIIDRQLGRLGR